MFRLILLITLALTAYSCGYRALQETPQLNLTIREIDFIETPSPNEEDYENIRIYADYSNLESNDPTIRDYIQNQLVPSVISYYEATLKVRRLPGRLQVPQDLVCGIYNPPAYFSEPGVDADLAVIVVADSFPNATFIAGGVNCALSRTNNRPVYGLMLINLDELLTGGIIEQQNSLGVVLHEFVHILGFSLDLYHLYINPITGENIQDALRTKTVNGREIAYLDVEPLTSRVRDYFGCDTVEGAYLENDGTLQSQGSHFERRVFMNEIMTSNNITAGVVSEFTLALLEGSGWYKPDYNMAEPLNWGRGEGCSFLDGPCVDDQGNPNFPGFCNPDVLVGCSYTSRGKAYCEGGQYRTDVFDDSCPYYITFPIYDCENPENQAGSPFLGEFYGQSSRCYTGTLANSTSEPAYGAFCFTSRCDELGDGFRLVLTINSNEITCENAGPVSISGYNGELNCPDPDEFCVVSSPSLCERGCSGRGTCVRNKCKCPSGWGGVDCAERVFDKNCKRCANEKCKGCYGDQCLDSPDDITFDSQP